MRRRNWKLAAKPTGYVSGIWSTTLKTMEEAERKLTGPYQQLWLGWLDSEYGEVRAALSWSLESGRIEAGLRIAVAIYQYWVIRDYAEEGLAWLERLILNAGDGVPPAVRANALAYAAFLAGFRGNTEAQMAVWSPGGRDG